MCEWLIGHILKNDSSLSCMNLIKALSTRCGYFWKWSFFLRFKTNAETMKIRYRSYPLLSILDVWYHLIREPPAFSCVHTKTISRRLWCPKTPFTCRRNARREEKNLIITKIIYGFWPANIFTIAFLHLFFKATIDPLIRRVCVYVLRICVSYIELGKRTVVNLWK